MIFWILLFVFWFSVFSYLVIRFFLGKQLSKTELIFIIVSNFLSAVFANEIIGNQFLTYLIGLY